MTERLLAIVLSVVVAVVSISLLAFALDGDAELRYVDSGCYRVSETSGCIVNGMGGLCDIDARYALYGNQHLPEEEWIPLPLSVTVTAWCYEFPIGAFQCKETETESGSGTVLASMMCYFTSSFGTCTDDSYSFCRET